MKKLNKTSNVLPLIERTTKRQKRKSYNPPYTVEYLGELHQTLAWQAMVEHQRAAEREHAEQCREPLRPTVDRVLLALDPYGCSRKQEPRNRPQSAREIIKTLCNAIREDLGVQRTDGVNGDGSSSG
jgi:hypothetical protein